MTRVLSEEDGMSRMQGFGVSKRGQHEDDKEANHPLEYPVTASA